MLRVFAFLALAISAQALSPFEKYPNAIPKSIGVPTTDFAKMSMEEWKTIVEENSGLATTERYPGFKRGTKNFTGECGTRPMEDKIVGGNEATPHSYPWMAALFFTQNNQNYFCGGTLIGDQWVLTAAHCVEGDTEVEVFLGAHNVRADADAETEAGRIDIKSDRFFAHEKWNQLTISNDIALVHLPEPVTFTDTIRPICLPSYSQADEKFAGLTAPASGWGKPSDSATSISPVLRGVDCETITNLACVFELFQINKNNICISGAGGKSVCNGDSGGPLHLVRDDGTYMQIGITSFGSGLGCELGIHAAFTRTTSYLEWIETNTNIMIDP